MKNIILPLVATFFIATSFYGLKEEITNARSSNKDTLSTVTSLAKVEKLNLSSEVYQTLVFDEEVLESTIFEKAFKGFERLKQLGKIPQESTILTICDFSLSSNKKRLWVIDVQQKKILFNTLVAHGKNTGEEFAENFSNTESSLQSSMGFFVTDGTYVGENGYSLKLHGMDPGYNDAALKRLIVMHGADYVSPDFAAKHNRIGRSWGCPAIPRALAEPIINTIKNQNVLFIYYPNQEYLQNSEWLNS